MPKPFPIKNTLSIASLITTFFATNLHAQSMTDLGTLSGASSYAVAISADGLVIAGYGAVTGGALHAFKYVGATMTDLGTLGGTRSMAYGVSGDGSVIVGSSYPTGSISDHAFKYVGTTMTDLGTLGGNMSRAYAVSGDGLVIVGDSAAIDGRTRAFKYIGTTMTDLPPILNTYYKGLWHYTALSTKSSAVYKYKGI